MDDSMEDRCLHWLGDPIVTIFNCIIFNECSWQLQYQCAWASIFQFIFEVNLGSGKED